LNNVDLHSNEGKLWLAGGSILNSPGNLVIHIFLKPQPLYRSVILGK